MMYVIQYDKGYISNWLLDSQDLFVLELRDKHRSPSDHEIVAVWKIKEKIEVKKQLRNGNYITWYTTQLALDNQKRELDERMAKIHEAYYKTL